MNATVFRGKPIESRILERPLHALYDHTKVFPTIEKTRDGFVYGDLIHSLDHDFVHGQPIDPMKRVYYILSAARGKVQVIPNTISQYTHIDDANDQMIFEYDIMGQYDEKTDQFMQYGMVIYNKASYIVIRDSPDQGQNLYELMKTYPSTVIIGNCWDGLRWLREYQDLMIKYVDTI